MWDEYHVFLTTPFITECSWAGRSSREEQNMAPSLPLLPWELLVFVKENNDRKKTLKAITLNNFCNVYFKDKNEWSSKFKVRDLISISKQHLSSHMVHISGTCSSSVAKSCSDKLNASSGS